MNNISDYTNKKLMKKKKYFIFFVIYTSFFEDEIHRSMKIKDWLNFVSKYVLNTIQKNMYYDI